MIDISIIMPVYNSLKYLSTAVRSVLNQDFLNFELILVDDGSSDGSEKLCDKLASADSRIRVFHKPNGGMCNARNFALDKARGTYVTFCDNDDTFLPGNLSSNYQIAVKDNADCVRFRRQLLLYDNLSKKPRVSVAGPTSRGRYEGDDIFLHYDAIRCNSMGVWNGLYKKALLDRHNIRFDERLRHGFEDQLFNVEVFQAAHTISTNPETCYAWIKRASHSSSFNITDDYRLGFENIVKTEHDLLLSHKVQSTNPKYYGWLMVNQMLLPLETLLLSKGVDIKSVTPLFEWERNLFLPYRDEIEACPLSAPYRVMFELLMKKRYRTMLLCIRLAGIYLAATKRT